LLPGFPGITRGLALEVGPGPGYLGLEWLKRTDGTTLKGLDLSADMLRVAERNAAEYGMSDRVEYVHGGGDLLPFENGTFDAVFSNMVRAPIHGSTFSKNNLAMAAGIATLEVLRQENLVENAAKVGEGLIGDLRNMVERFSFMHEVRGKGCMIAVEFAPPSGLKHRAAWKLLDTAQKGLFAQLVVVPLFQRHRILCQTSGHDAATVKFLPPLVIGNEHRVQIASAFEQVMGETEKVGGAIWDLGKTLARAALQTRGRSQ